MSKCESNTVAIPGQLREEKVTMQDNVRSTIINYFPAFLLKAPSGSQIAIGWDGHELCAKIDPKERDFFAASQEPLPMYADVADIPTKVIEWCQTERPDWRALVTLLFRINGIRFGTLTPLSVESTPESAL